VTPNKRVKLPSGAAGTGGELKRRAWRPPQLTRSVGRAKASVRQVH